MSEKDDRLDLESFIAQIMKVCNVSAPKANQTSKVAPKLLKLQLTDGVKNFTALTVEPTSLSVETKPGTKVRNFSYVYLTVQS